MLRRKRSYWITISVLALVILIIAILPATQGYSAAAVLSTVLPYVLIFGGIVIALPLVQRWQLKRFYQQTPTWQQEQTHEFSEEGLRMSNPLSNSIMRWDAFVEVVETKEFFLFSSSRSMAHFLPKRAITAPDQLRDLRALLETELARRGRKARVLAA
jgi:YcxB-like protein